MPLLPAYFMLLDRFNPADDLRSYRGPAIFVLAGADEIIGAASGRRLFDEFQGPKELQLIPGAGHNEIEAQSVEWWRAVVAFWNQHRHP